MKTKKHINHILKYRSNKHGFGFYISYLDSISFPIIIFVLGLTLIYVGFRDNDNKTLISGFFISITLICLIPLIINKVTKQNRFEAIQTDLTKSQNSDFIKHFIEKEYPGFIPVISNDTDLKVYFKNAS